jgi:hypothetical protein
MAVIASSTYIVLCGLGPMDNPNYLHWRRVTQPGCTKNSRMAKVPGGYGPIMKLWTRELGIVYHFDKQLTQKAMVLEQNLNLKEKTDILDHEIRLKTRAISNTSLV